MNWTLNLSDRTLPGDLAETLGRLRDKWVEETPQSSHDYTDIDQLIYQMYGADRAPLVARKAQRVKASSTTLDAVHTMVLADMNLAITHAAEVATSMGEAPVRVTISGHYMPDHDMGIDKRVVIQIDQAL